MDQCVRLSYMGRSPLHETQKPYMVSPGYMKSIPLCNYRLEAGPEQVIKDVRGCTEDFTLDKQGFTFRSWVPTKIDWQDEGQILGTFLPEAKELLRQQLNLGDRFKGCEIFDWRLRSTASEQRLTNIDKGRMKIIRPAETVHIDQSSCGAFDRLKLLLSAEEFEHITSKFRVQIFNVWRPIRGVVEQWPLGVCDAQTVTMDDLDDMDYITEEFVRGSYLVKWSEHLRFYYLSNMTSDEVCIFKIFDSAYHIPHDPAQKEYTVGCPHMAFKIGSVTSAPPRESVEVRLFVFSEH